MKIENVSLVPNISTEGHLEDNSQGEIYWFNDSETGISENLNISSCDSILIDKLSSTVLLSTDDSNNNSNNNNNNKNIKMLHFLNGNADKFAEYFINRSFREVNFIQSNTGPYIQFTKRSMEKRTLDFDEATVNVLDAFAKVPLLAKGFFDRLRGEPQYLRRPRGINKSRQIPRNPWIFDKPIELPVPRIQVFANVEGCATYEQLPKDIKVKALMIYNSGGTLINNNKDRADFWLSVLCEKEKSTTMSYADATIAVVDKENYSRIEKDLNRLGERDVLVLERLKLILQEYCNNDCEVGYVQGMSDLALPFAKLYPNHLIGSKCFQSLMRRIRNNFLDSPEHGISHQLTELRELINEFSPMLSDYLKFNRDSDNLFFAYRWLLILFRREFPSEAADRLWDVMLAADVAGISKLEDFRIYLALAMIMIKKPVFMDTCVRFEDLLKVKMW